MAIYRPRVNCGHGFGAYGPDYGVAYEACGEAYGVVGKGGVRGGELLGWGGHALFPCFLLMRHLLKKSFELVPENIPHPVNLSIA